MSITGTPWGYVSVFKTFRAVAQSVRDVGLYQTLKRYHLYNTIRPGVYKGSDELGNRYYIEENAQEESIMYLRSRWVELSGDNTAGAGKYDYTLNPTRIPAAYHSWMTHITDDFPTEGKYVQPVYQLKHIGNPQSTLGTDAPFVPGTYGITNPSYDVTPIQYPYPKYTTWKNISSRKTQPLTAPQPKNVL